MLVQSELTKIIIDIFLPSSVKNNKNVDDLKIMDKKLNSPIDFYSYNWRVMINLAEKTRDTANLIVGNGWLRRQNNNLNKDPDFTKGLLLLEVDLLMILLIESTLKMLLRFLINNLIQNHIQKFFPSYHVRRVRLKKKHVDRDKMLSVEKVHFLYGSPIRFEV
ncbi:hypothetical protein [Mesomycoplasma ovipneumoniae]|uniref:hypothetical protein n=2 Tax=Mesomycoplasma ovipneumoniae TaxID=29562 RepID=UPI002079EA83|nr:hypothetical protein [Mesomycoplasma ovipneumoniae]MCN0157992.1 hypothetical protein [Mesomycoplasma ovipneumoniae]MDW2919117.1 hypothetical protein [Mesomycoplasma ovipneumoniae]MDW2932139.1 hypothetical protein [Mesomycoplasma ovipneumoniae]